MTTIAYDGKTLAVDSMASNDAFVTSQTTQKMWHDIGEFNCVVMAGPVSHFPPILTWLRLGANPETWVISWEAVAWTVGKDGIVRRFVAGYPSIVDSLDADGSGAELALGAMAAGATAAEAVRIAAKYDFYTGGEIHHFDITAAPQGRHLNAV